jgi:ATP-dependent Lon protease
VKKIEITKQYLIKKQCEANGLSEKHITFTESALRFICHRYTREAGVRNLDRTIASLCRKVARDLAKETDREKFHVTITPKRIQELLGPPKFRYGLAEEQDEIGMCTGLAWTEVGGELLNCEVSIMPGRGKLTLTGKLGDVMQESAQAALSYVRSRAEAMGLERHFIQRLDIHVHMPEGAIPKDGPSAGICMATAITSALIKQPVRKDVAMTGEITLRGRVLPIGGLKEKLLAAHRGGIKTIIIPKENVKDLKEIPKDILKELEIKPVEHADEVLKIAMVLEKPEDLFAKASKLGKEVSVIAKVEGDAKPQPVTAGPH